MPVSNQPQITDRLGKVRFGVFEADLDAGELRRSGIRIKLQLQPFKLLACLLERPGEIVSREEMQQRLWGDQTTVDFDHSLGTAINKLREALGDSAENPRFVETLARRGYRFIAPVSAAVPELTLSPSTGRSIATSPEPITSPPRRNAGSAGASVIPLWVLLTGCVFAILIVALMGSLLLREPAPHAPAKISQVTFSGRVSPGAPQLESLPRTAVDGSRIYYMIIENGRAVLSQASVRTGQSNVLPVPSEIIAPTIGDISPDGTRLVLRNHLSPEVEQALWIVPTLGGTARRMSRVLAHDATWMPDGSRVLFANGRKLFIANEDGSNLREFASVPGRAFWLRWSPDGSVLRFTLLDSLNHTKSLWQVAADGRNARPVLPGWSMPASECCGSWTADSKYFVFQSSHSGASNIWALSESASLPGKARHSPMQVTNGPLSYSAPITARDGHRIFFIGSDARYQLLQFDRVSKRLVPYKAGLSSVYRVEFSRDGKWLAWVDPRDGSMWRSRRDGSERLQLTSAPVQIFMMRWSPDDNTLAVMAREPGAPWKIYLLPGGGGNLQTILSENRNEADPDWSPDGRFLVLGRLPNLMAEPAQSKSIHIYDLQQKQLTSLPQSEGLFSPRWSPDGRYIAATSLDQQKLLLFDTRTHDWKTLAVKSIADPAWSHDGKWIYFHAFLEGGQPIYRVSVPDGHLESITGLANFQSADVVDYTFAGLSPDDSPLVRARMWTANIYSMNLDQQFR